MIQGGCLSDSDSRLCPSASSKALSQSCSVRSNALIMRTCDLRHAA